MNRIAATFAAAALATTLTQGALAQPPAAAVTSIAPPTSGLIANYRYWPTQYVQFVGAELPYAMIALEADTTGKKPLYYVTLTTREGKRIHYGNADVLVASGKAMGEEAYKTEIAVDGGDKQTNGDITTVRFTMADGKPVQWRFVQGSDISEQGAGLTPLALPMPIFAYREQAAVAGEGTALEIGGVVSTADVWKEISQPPYFIAYHGALSQSAHTLAFLPGKETWTVTSSPSALTAGAAWELDGATGDHRTLRIEKSDGAHFLISGTDRFQPSVRFVLDATRTADGWTVASVRYAPLRDGDKHFLTLTTPPADGKPAEIALTPGKKKAIATGTLAAAGSAADRTLTLDFATPAWTRGKSMSEQTVSTATTVTVIAHPASAVK